MTTKEMKSLDFGNGVVYELVDAVARSNVSNKADASVVTTQTVNTLSSGTINLVEDVAIYKHTPATATTYSFNTSNLSLASNEAYTFELYISMSSSVYTLTFPSTLTWQGGEAPDLSEAGMYFFAFRTLDGGSHWIGNLQGVWS